MACPHGSGSPSRCSQCRGAAPRQVTRRADGTLLVDGRPATRPFQLGTSSWPLANRRGRPRKEEAQRRAAQAVVPPEDLDDID